MIGDFGLMMDSKEEICILSSDGQKFFSCRQTLSENSDFFSALFNSGMKECQQKSITLPGLPPSGLKLAFKYMQKKEIQFPMDSMQSILEVCTYLQMKELTEYCSQHIHHNITTSDWFMAYECAKEFNLDQLKGHLLSYFASNFRGVSEMNEFYTLALDSVMELLEGPIHDDSEVEIYKVAFKWLSKNESFQNNDVAGSILSCVRFPLMTTDELNTCLDELHLANISDQCIVFSKISIARDVILNPSLLCQMDLGKFTMPRRMEPCVLALGGFTKSNHCTNRLMVLPVDNVCNQETDHDRLTWKCHPPSKNSPRLLAPLCEHSVAVVGVFVFVVGGQTPYCWDGRHSRTNVYRYDTRLNKWSEVPFAFVI